MAINEGTGKGGTTAFAELSLAFVLGVMFE
jgi:hypothetical protein